MDRLLKALISTLFRKFIDDLSERVRTYLFDAIKPILRKVIQAIIGTSLVIIGVIFICVSLVKYLSINIPAWMAWGLVGVIIFIIGIILSMLGLKK